MFNYSFNPVWSFVDLNGLQLDDTYYLFTLNNLSPFNPEPVYSTQSGTPWENPIQFLANGTLPIDIFWDDSKTYLLQIRQGDSPSDPLIYSIPNYVPVNGGGGPTPPAPGNNSTDNLITNPQFYDIQFQTELSITTPGTTQIAPGWQVVTTGSGVLTINQGNLSGNQNVSGNPSYYMTFSNSGFSQISLQQVFAQNGALWASEYVAMSITGMASTPTIISTFLNYSGTHPTTNIISTTFQSGWTTESGTTENAIPASTNRNFGAAAYTTLNINWIGNVTVSLTNIQLIGQDVGDDSVTYAQIPIERQIDHEFHYYLPQLEYKPISSYLIGWDFPLNPCQERGTSVSINVAPYYYVADQTILYQAVLSNFTVLQSNIGLSLTAIAPSTFAIFQYLDGNTPIELLQQRMSSLVQGYTGTGTINATVNLAWTALSNIIPSPVVSSVTAGPVTSFTAGWNVVPRTLGSASFQLSTVSKEFSFVGFDATAVSGIKTAKFFAIIISFDTASGGQVITVSRASLNGGDIATLPAPQSAASVLNDCQTYYQKSFKPGIAPAQAVGLGNGETYGVLFNGGNSSFNAICISYTFPVPLRTTPVLTTYNPESSNNQIRTISGTNRDMTLTAANYLSSRSFYLEAQTGTVGFYNASSPLAVNWTADARIGVV